MALVVEHPSGLTPEAVKRYVDHLSGNKCLFPMVHESFHLTFQKHQNITQEELQQLAAWYRGRCDAELADMLGRVMLIGDGSRVIIVNPEERPDSELTKFWIIFELRSDSRYDLIVVKATQKKVLSKKKIISAISGSVVMGALGTTILFCASASHPVTFGVAIAATLTAGSAAKAAYDYNAVMENVIAGYVCKELEDLRVIQVGSESITLL